MPCFALYFYFLHFIIVKWQLVFPFLSSLLISSISEVAQSCLTPCNPMDCSLPGFSVHGTFQARVLEWVAMPSSRGSPWPRDRTQVSCTAGRFFTAWATREAQINKDLQLNQNIPKTYHRDKEIEEKIFRFHLHLKMTGQRFRSAASKEMDQSLTIDTTWKTSERIIQVWS